MLLIIGKGFFFSIPNILNNVLIYKYLNPISRATFSNCLERPAYQTDVLTSINCRDRWSRRPSSNGDTAATVAVATLTTATIGAVGIRPTTDPSPTNMMAGEEAAPVEQFEIEEGAVEVAEGIAEGISMTTGVILIEAGGAGLIVYFAKEAYRRWKNSNTNTAQEDITEEDRQVKYYINGPDGFSCSGDTRLEDHDQVNLKAVTQNCHLESGKEYFVTVTHANGKKIIRGEKYIAP